MIEDEEGGNYVAGNGFRKEYVTGRKDQWDIDYKIMMKGFEMSKTKEQFFEFLKEKMNYVIMRVSSERAEDLMEEMELV
ncbi:MAG: hypothetical protein QXU18_04225 [Thermoplasmatales archaeon]